MFIEHPCECQSAKCDLCHDDRREALAQEFQHMMYEYGADTDMEFCDCMYGRLITARCSQCDGTSCEACQKSIIPCDRCEDLFCEEDNACGLIGTCKQCIMDEPPYEDSY